MTDARIIEKRKENNFVDLAKFIASFFVIAVHTNPFSSFSDFFNSYIVDMVARIGVCFFFVISGYFFFRSLEFNKGKIVNTKENRKKLRQYFIRLLILYSFWSMVYLLWSIPEWYVNGWLSINAFIDFGITFLFHQSYYHLWFLLSLLYAVPLVYLILNFIDIKKVVCIFAAVYIVGILSDTYSYLNLLPLGFLQEFSRYTPRFFTVIFRVLPLLSISLVADKIRLSKKKSLIFLIISFVLQSAEMCWRYITAQNKGSYTYTIFMITTLVFIMALITQVNIQIKFSYYMRKTSTIIYCLHPLIMGIFAIFINPDKINSLIYYLLIILSTTLVSVLIVLLFKKCRYFKWLKYVM